MTNDTGSPLAQIAAVLERYQSILQPTPLVPFDEQSLPVFNPRVLQSVCQLPHSQTDIIQRISSWSLPENVSNQITNLLTEESSQYQALIQHVRAEVLGKLIKTSATPDPSIIPSLIESACNAAYKSAIDNMLLGAQRQVESFSLNDDDMESDGDSGSASLSEDDYEGEDDDDDDAVDEQEGEEDNSPMKPGEEVPPLETKYLPIFEALHERGKVLTKPEKTYLVNMTGMTYRQITIWFQNRRRGELKESTNMVASYSKASSTHSDESSDLSEQELEKTLGGYPPNTTFDIRSWRLQSAVAAKEDNRGSAAPFSPFKYNFPSIRNPSDTQSDTDLSDDSDADVPAPPGLRTPSLNMSTAIGDSNINHYASTSMTKSSTFQPLATTGNIPIESTATTHSRPIRSLPSSRRGSPPTTFQQAQLQRGHLVQSTALHYQSHQPEEATQSSPQCVSSNERGLTVNVESMPQMQVSTLRSSPVLTPLVPANALISGAPGISPSPPSTSSESPRLQASPTSSTSPRPHIKPLPRRTGCAPRPRPPPRLGPSASTPALTTALSSSRPSVVLPPSSNPSLGNTTLGALLRPNPPAPAIPQEIEERLTAMAGRMGVGATSALGSGTARGIPFGISSNRSAPFSFGPASLPKTGNLPGVQPASEQFTQSSISPPSPRQ